MSDGPDRSGAVDGATAPAVVTRDRSNPSLFLALATDPTIPTGERARELAVRDLARPSHRIVLPLVRPLSLALVLLIRAVKWIVPFQFSWHDGIDILCLWFVRRFMSADACEQLARHFVVETNLLQFIARNCGQPIEAPTLRPLALAQLADRAVLIHDINVYNLVIDVGTSNADIKSARALSSLDFSMLVVPPIDAERHRRRWLELDIETCLYLMNIPFCLFTTQDEYERAVNSFQLDESVLAMLAGLTGDSTFRTWTPLKFPLWVSVARDVPKELYLHATVCEYAHTHLASLAPQGVTA